MFLILSLVLFSLQSLTQHSLVSFLAFAACFLVTFLLSVSMSLNSFTTCEGVMYDEASLFIFLITVLVLYISVLFSPLNTFTFPLSFSFSGTLLSSSLVFVTTSSFTLYVIYEVSLLPILYIILVWGSYPERSESAFLLFSFTAFFSFPFLMTLWVFFHSYGSFSFSLSIVSSFPTCSILFVVLTFLAFSVNLPVYGLHFWLPIAHVEAPTFGSIILAGILLNLGGVGLIRFSSLVLYPSMNDYILMYSLLSIVVVTVICCVQSDFNRLVAYSSVSHIIAVPLLLLANSPFSFNSILLVMFFHGLSSPLMFMFVGISYSLFSTRQLSLIRGLVLSYPLLSFLMVLGFFFTLSAPPFPSFVAEVYFFSSIIHFSSLVALFLLLFAFLSLVYNVNWLSSILFSFSQVIAPLNQSLSYSSFVAIIVPLLCVPFLCLLVPFF